MLLITVALFHWVGGLAALVFLIAARAIYVGLWVAGLD